MYKRKMLATYTFILYFQTLSKIYANIIQEKVKPTLFSRVYMNCIQ